GYGKVLGRPGLGLAVRELCIVALLAVADAPTQLYSHLRGALNVGAPSGAVEEALALAAEVSGPGPRRRASEAWARVAARRGGGPGRSGRDT
ncbi:MAG TPA: carboxymuconolactone decarboxylase family protein, partial [Longimicrobiales bacterium]|nr:carboxymuconolactone decarboxylase family protein [Longimicrobiales bacterium]